MANNAHSLLPLRAGRGGAEFKSDRANAFTTAAQPLPAPLGPG